MHGIDSALENRASPGDSLAPQRYRHMNRRLARAVIAVVAITVIISILRREIIDAPPYYDFGFSVWLEARYLANSGFDYWGLRYEEEFLLEKEGGTRAYMTSVLPTVIAVCLTLSPTVRGALIAYHVFTFFCASLVTYAVYAIVRPRLGKLRAFLLTLAVMTTPLFCAQIDMMGMEIPLAGMTCLSALALDRGAYRLSVLAGMAAFLMKASGLIVSVALAIVLSSLLFFGLLGGGLDRERFRRLGVAWLWSIAVLGAQYALINWGGAFHGQIMGGAPLAMTLVWCPDAVMVGLLTLVVGGYPFVRWIRRIHRTSRSLRQWGAKIFEELSANPTIAFGTLVVLGITAAIHRGPFLVRYLAFAIPMLYLVLAFPLFAWGRRWRGGLAFLIVVVVVNLVNWNGAWYPDIANGFVRFWGLPGPLLARSGSFFERSHEYLEDHRKSVDLVRYLDEHCRGQAVVVGLPFTFFLEFPEFGYVKERFPVYSNNAIKGIDPDAKDARDFMRERPANPILVRVPNYFTASTPRFDIPPPLVGDMLLHADGDRYPMLVYRKGWGTTSPTEEDLDAWYREQSWRGESFAARLFVELGSVGLTGVISTLEGELAADPPLGRRRQLRLLLAFFLLRQGRIQESESIFRDAEAMASKGIGERDPAVLLPLAPPSQFDRDFALARTNAQDTWGALLVCLKHGRLPEAAWVVRGRLLRRFPSAASTEREGKGETPTG